MEFHRRRASLTAAAVAPQRYCFRRVRRWNASGRVAVDGSSTAASQTVQRAGFRPHDGPGDRSLDGPLLSKKTARVHYVDRASQADLVEEFSPERHNHTCNAAAIVPTNVIWENGVALAERAAEMERRSQ